MSHNHQSAADVNGWGATTRFAAVASGALIVAMLGMATGADPAAAAQSVPALEALADLAGGL